MIDKIKQHIQKILEDEAYSNLKYHNFSHTEGVVQRVNILANGEKVSDDDKEALIIAAWFHDIGYLKDSKNHEAIGFQMASEFLDEHQYKPELKPIIEPLIMVTKMGAAPSTLLERIIKDADMGHIGSKAYPQIANDLRKEWKICDGKEMSDLEWLTMNKQFLTHHKFYTDTATNLYSDQKAQNIEIVEKMIEAEQRSTPKKKKSKKKKSKKPSTNGAEKGRETAYRVALRNHIQLSKIADNKANIMLSINALILSFLLGSGIPRVEEEIHFLIPSLIIILTSILSIIFATLSTRPKVTHGHLSKEEIESKMGNLLFFGNFHAMDLETYEWGMNRMMKDSDYLYNSLNRDLFFLGKVMNQKYKWLNITYSIFAIGMILSTLSFLFISYQHM